MRRANAAARRAAARTTRCGSRARCWTAWTWRSRCMPVPPAELRPRADRRDDASRRRPHPRGAGAASAPATARMARAATPSPRAPCWNARCWPTQPARLLAGAGGGPAAAFGARLYPHAACRPHHRRPGRQRRGAARACRRSAGLPAPRRAARAGRLAGLPVSASAAGRYKGAAARGERDDPPGPAAPAPRAAGPGATPDGRRRASAGGRGRAGHAARRRLRASMPPSPPRRCWRWSSRKPPASAAAHCCCIGMPRRAGLPPGMGGRRRRPPPRPACSCAMASRCPSTRRRSAAARSACRARCGCWKRRTGAGQAALGAALRPGHRRGGGRLPRLRPASPRRSPPMPTGCGATRRPAPIPAAGRQAARRGRAAAQPGPGRDACAPSPNRAPTRCIVGPIAADIATAVRAHANAGFMTTDDLAGYAPRAARRGLRRPTAVCTAVRLSAAVLRAASRCCRSWRCLAHQDMAALDPRGSLRDARAGCGASAGRGRADRLRRPQPLPGR